MYLANQNVDQVGFFPFIVPVLIGAGVLGAGAIGYKIGKPEYDAQGNRIPGVTERAAQEVGKGIGNAVMLAAIIGLGYMIYTKENKK